MTNQINKLLKEWNNNSIKIKPQDIVNVVKDTIHFKSAKIAWEVFNYYAKLWNESNTEKVLVSISHDNLKLEVNNNTNELVLIDNKPRIVIEFNNNFSKLERDIVDLVFDLTKPITFTKQNISLGNGIKLVANPLYE